MAAESPGKGINFQGTVGTTAVVTVAFTVSQLEQMAYQIRTDGAATLSYTVQASNVPAQPADFGPPYRNDSATSNDWATVQTGTVGSNAAGASQMITLVSVPYRNTRLLLTAPSNTVTTVYAFGTGAAS